MARKQVVKRRVHPHEALWLRSHTWTKKQALSRAERVRRKLPNSGVWSVVVQPVSRLVPPESQRLFRYPKRAYWYTVTWVLHNDMAERERRITVSESLYPYQVRYKFDLFDGNSYNVAYSNELEAGLTSLLSDYVGSLGRHLVNRMHPLYDVVRKLDQVVPMLSEFKSLFAPVNLRRFNNALGTIEALHGLLMTHRDMEIW